MEQISIGNKIKEFRLKNQLTQQQLALLIGVSNKAISKWENNEGYPDIQNLKRLAEVFNTTVDYLISDKYKTNEYTFNLKSLFIVLLILISLGLLFAKYMPFYVPFNDMLFSFVEKEYLSYTSSYLSIKNLFQYGVIDDYGFSIAMLLFVVITITNLFLLLRGRIKAIERFRIIFVGTFFLQVYCFTSSLFYINYTIRSYEDIYNRVKIFPSPFEYLDTAPYLLVIIQILILILMYSDKVDEIIKLIKNKLSF